MKTLIAAVMLFGFASAAHALPVAPLPADEAITQVAQGCGPGMRRNARGQCRPAFMARHCPPGTRRNAVGMCRPWRR